jgi:hypothetical protein
MSEFNKAAREKAANEFYQSKMPYGACYRPTTGQEPPISYLMAAYAQKVADEQAANPKYVAKLVRKLYNERSDLLDIADRTDEEEERLVNIETAIGMYPTRRNPAEQEAMDLIMESAAVLRTIPKEVDKLRNQLEIAKKALEHYADGRWVCRYDGLVGHRCNPLCRKNALYGGSGYEVAQQALKELQETPK